MKDDIRNKLKTERKNFQGVRRELADKLIKEQFLASYGNYDSFFIYNSFSAETDTKAIISALVSLGKQVLLPRVEGKEIVSVPYGKTCKGAFGVEEPEGQAYTGKIDVVAVPLLACNERGYRIGYGGGFYDRYLKNSHALKVGIGYDFQRENFCEDEWDEKLNFLVTERGIYNFGK